MITARLKRFAPAHRPSSSDDLLIVLGLVVLTNLVVVWLSGNDSPARAVLGLLYVLFLPGYACVSAFFPQRPQSDADRDDERPVQSDAFPGNPRTAIGGRPFRRGIDTLERIGLGFAISIALVPLVAVLLSLSPIGYSFWPMLAAITLLIVGLTGIAAIRRWLLPVEARYSVSLSSTLQAGWDRLTAPSSSVDILLNVGVAIAILIAVGALGAGAMMPPDGEQFTDFYLVDDGEADNPLAANSTVSLSPNEAVPAQLGIENHEEEPVDYQVVAYLQRVEDGENTIRITDRSELDRFSVSVAEDETTIEERELIIPGDQTGSDLQIVFLLFTEDIPEEPTRDNAYRDLYVWVDVEESTQ